jgi:hypothetical protein
MRRIPPKPLKDGYADALKEFARGIMRQLFIGWGLLFADIRGLWKMKYPFKDSLLPRPLILRFSRFLLKCFVRIKQGLCWIKTAPFDEIVHSESLSTGTLQGKLGAWQEFSKALSRQVSDRRIIHNVSAMHIGLRMDVNVCNSNENVFLGLTYQISFTDNSPFRQQLALAC